jgi:hypothetical protein
MGGEEWTFSPTKSWGAGVVMHPELMLMVVREEHERVERDAARRRLAASLNGPRRPRLPRRILGRLLVGVGQWLLASSRATPTHLHGTDAESPAPASGPGRAMMAP